MFFSLFLALLFQSAEAAPCCAGASAIPSLITSDESKLIGLSIGWGEVIGDAPGANQGIPVFRDALSNREIRKTMTIQAATLISDRWQIGASIPVVQNEITSGSTQESSTQLGDLSATVGYELLPEWDYSVWKPRVHVFLQWVAPTGRSIFESKSLLASDVSGQGTHQLHAGGVAIKRWSDWDVNAVMKFGADLRYDSFYGGLSVGAGYSFSEVWRVGMSLEDQYQSPQFVEGLWTSQRQVWNTGANLTYLVGQDSSLVLAYQDQTLFGPAINTTLARTASLAFQQRFER